MKIMTVKDLKKIIRNLPDTYDVCIQVNTGNNSNPRMAYHVVEYEVFNNPRNEYGTLYLRNFKEQAD